MATVGKIQEPLLAWGRNILQVGFQALGAVAPEVAGRVALRLFCTPRRRPPSPRDMQFLATAGVMPLAFQGRTLRGYVWGEGPTVVLVHGWESRASHWRGFVGPLVRAGYRVVAFDGPAHGDSGGKQTNLAEWMAMVEAAVQTIGPVHALVGHSMGGAAVLLAVVLEALPVGRVVTIGAPAHLGGVIGRFARAVGLSERVEAAMHMLIAQQFGRPVSDYTVARAALPASMQVLVVHDRQDEVIPFEDAQLIAGTWPTVRLYPTEGLGHHRALQSREVIRDVVAFLREATEADGTTAGFETRVLEYALGGD